ncbi:lycopene beta-cyclase CrtY [Sphingomonas sp. AP4-R1]|uniref:lycopene beta-cyclase CrtY n=1 Tax=Sphingomonas sp. AP4-R1 TaxID=2735134 RepID=UPI00149341AF|nr:lycopene beta-cyclase CrtY [Sphingomonas sp. AP4-R1]QJU57200.1 lycopene beta-cyclase CrtY [Sphingomonas sp. AP4-R1]
MARPVDLLIAGGGLAGGLLALAIRARRPGTRVMLVESGERIGGNHIWSFFGSDIAPEDMGLVAPLICHSWEGYDVAFPRYARSIPNAYHSIESERLDAVVRTALPPEDLVTGARVMAVDRGGVTLVDGSRIEAESCIDARGARDLSALELGWQKFVGQLLVLDRPHGLTRPTIMDATVDQADGYRFVYLLPFGPDRLFVEDTYYTTGAELDVPAIRTRIADYAAARGWSVRAVEREEAAALPIATGGNFELLWRTGPQWIGKIGMGAGLFQPMTGYSLPDAVRTASLVASLPSLEVHALHEALRVHAEKAWKERGYYRLLARMLFRAAAPADRYRMLERFYALDGKLIARFYAGQSTGLDKARIMCGKPPVPLGRAMRVILGG